MMDFDDKDSLQDTTSHESGGAYAESDTAGPGVMSRTAELSNANRAHDPDGIQAAAREGTEGAGGMLPHFETIQASFGGGHDLSAVRAHTGQEAASTNAELGSNAYAFGDDIAFGGAPDLFTAAHEAAHVVQQRSGMGPSSGVGHTGDAFESQANQVAERVVSGQSAADLLGSSPTVAPAAKSVQFIGTPLNERVTAAEAPAHGEDQGEQRRYSVEQYIEMWEKEQGRKMTDAEKKTIARGCIGITAMNLSGGGNPPLDNAYASFEAALEAQKKMTAYLEKMKAMPAVGRNYQNKHAVLFAKMFWSNQSSKEDDRKKPDPKAYKPDEEGKVDMKDYKYRSQPGYINFDYAFWDDTSKSFWHANHSQPGMKVYQSTKDKFAAGYMDFDRTIYCVAVAQNYDPGLAALATAR